MDKNAYLVSVLVPDRVGLLRDVTEAVFALGGNIGLIKQNLIDGFFNLVFVADFPPAVNKDSIESGISGNLKAENATITIRKTEGANKKSETAKGSRFIAVTKGEDRPGTIFAITSYFVAHNANIEEWNVSANASRVLYIAQINVPQTVDFRKLQIGFKDEMSKLGLSAVICHENIFRATNEIGPIRALLDGNAEE